MINHIFGSLWRGKTLLRALMNWELRNYSVSGEVLDIGGGEKPSYLNFLDVRDAEIINVDFKNKEMRVDLEKDSLPLKDTRVDYVLMFNILEHIYNYNHLLSECHRVMKVGGKVLGFVPFLINYHPDPNDYFRYTKEALLKIFPSNNFKVEEIKEIGLGPFSVNYNNLTPSFPMFLRILLFPFYYFLDKVFLKFRPRATERYPLGFFFVLRKQ